MYAFRILNIIILYYKVHIRARPCIIPTKRMGEKKKQNNNNRRRRERKDDIRRYIKL